MLQIFPREADEREERMLRLVLCVLLSCGAGRMEELSDDWVVEVEGGLEEARRLAAETDTELLGEVLPGSQLYHLRQRRRGRREVEGDHMMENLLEVFYVMKYL